MRQWGWYFFPFVCIESREVSVQSISDFVSDIIHSHQGLAVFKIFLLNQNHTSEENIQFLYVSYNTIYSENCNVYE